MLFATKLVQKEGEYIPCLFTKVEKRKKSFLKLSKRLPMTLFNGKQIKEEYSII
jgi:hypothetical protein